MNDLTVAITKTLTGPLHEQLVILDTLAKTVKIKSDEIRAELLKQMDGSYTLAAFDTHVVQRCKAPAKWQYIHDETLAGLQAQADVIDKKLRERQKFLQENGGANDENETNYIIRITEKKLTMEKRK